MSFYHVIKFSITQQTQPPTLNFSVPHALLSSNKCLLLDLVEQELSNVNKIKITIPIIQHVVNLLIKVTLIEKIENVEKEFKTKINFYDHNNNKIQELSRDDKYVYGDSIFIVYDHNQRWNYVTGSNLLLYKELVHLGAIDPSISNEIVTDLTKDILVSKLTPYLDSGLPLIPNEEHKNDDEFSPNLIVTHEGFPIDLYKYLDVNIGDSTSDGLDAGNKLETLESIDYLNRVIRIMQYYPKFFASVANQVTNQNELNTISIPLNSITTLTYPVNIKKSQYIGDIIIQNNIGLDSFSPVREVLLIPSSTIQYLGSDIEIYPNDTTFTLSYIYSNSVDGDGNPIISESAQFTPNSNTFVLTEVGSFITFTILAIDNENGSTSPLENVSSIFMLDCTNSIVGGTTSNITTEESSITFPKSALPLNNINSPYVLCIIYQNQILFNGDRTTGSVGIYINGIDSNINPSPPIPTTTPTQYSLDSTLYYSIQNYEGSSGANLQYNLQNILLDPINNKSVTFTITPTISTVLSDIFVFQTSDETDIVILNINSFNLPNNTVTIYYDLLQKTIKSGTYVLDQPIYVCFYTEDDEGGSFWYYLNIPIYINSTPYSPSSSNYPLNPIEPEKIGNCNQYNLTSPLAPEIPPTDTPFYHPVDVNTIVLFNLTISCHTIPPEFNLSTYSFELGFVKSVSYGEGSEELVFYPLNANLMANSTPELVMMKLYEYNTSETDPMLSFSSVNPGTYSVVLGYDYDICIAIRIPSDNSSEINYVRSNTLQFRFFLESGTEPEYNSVAGSLLSLVKYGDGISNTGVTGINFPVDGSLYTGVNSYPVTQGDTMNVYIYSPLNFFESIIYINGYELSYYTKEPESTNTYLGGSKSYRSPTKLDVPITVDGIEYKYYLKVSLRMTILPQKYYVSVFTNTKLSRGVYSYDYSINNLYLNITQQKDLLIQGALINGYIVPPNINTESTGYADIGLYSTINGHVILPPKSLYYYQTVNSVLGSVINGYFYVITGNTITNNANGVEVINGDSQNGLFSLEGQCYGKIVNTITPYSYTAIINNMLLYFKRIANSFGYGEVSKLIEVIDNKLFLLNQNISVVIQNIELTARNIYTCGKYTTNIYINGNALPVGISYYPNQVEWQGQDGQIPTSPNPDVNGVTGASGLNKYYIQYSPNGVTETPTPLIGEYWGIYSLCDDTVQLPKYWSISSPIVLPNNTKLDKFKGSNSFTTVNEIITDDPINNQIKFSTKNCIIIPSNYVGYGIIDTPTTPPYILTIYLNTYITTPENSNACDCEQSQIILNNTTILKGTEITIINNSSLNVRVISFDLSTEKPTPIPINLQDTTTDMLFISATDNMHLIFGENSWNII